MIVFIKNVAYRERVYLVEWRGMDDDGSTVFGSFENPYSQVVLDAIQLNTGAAAVVPIPPPKKYEIAYEAACVQRALLKHG